MHGHFDAAMLMAVGAVNRDVNSARPHAPVVPDVRRTAARARRLRSALARTLDRAARVVEPPAPHRPTTTNCCG
jgi:hypothetical protein